MGIKRYIVFTLIFLLGIGIYAYSLLGENYTLEVYSFSVTLPIAVWVILPAILLFIASIFHMMYYSFKEYLYQRALKKDFELFKGAYGRKILGEDSEVSYKTDSYKFIGKALKTLKFDTLPQDIDLEDESLKEFSQNVAKIEAGEVVELKKYKLSSTNPLIKKVKFNRLNADAKYASTILKECADECDDLCFAAYMKFLSYASFDEIKKLGFKPTRETFRLMMERYLDEEDKFDMPLESIEDLLLQFKATRDDYLELAYEIKAKLNPDAWMALFEKLYNSQEQHAEAADAYLYVLYELQMIDKIREILDNSEEGEYVKFKTLLFLRDHGKNVNSGLFLRFS
ncbi:MAG: hypothetical protein PWQ42_434 [Sulfurospirillum sp.]|jgi:hypothetical protein|nr:hypothetical protein [Sulfurospirillum sp.]DAB33975.1 MAG TPA: fatty-acid--CoA ligase [Sulfurospirillum sp. UBA12182]